MKRNEKIKYLIHWLIKKKHKHIIWTNNYIVIYTII